MSGKQFGSHLKLELFGSSHGPEVGCELRGLRRGLPLDLGEIQAMLDRRAPARRSLGTRRRERDLLIVEQGIRNGRSTGSVLRAHVLNEDVRRSDYARIRSTPRPGHADYPARVRYGPDADLSGGGIFSGRMTVGLVIAGAVCGQLLGPLGVRAAGFVASVGAVEGPSRPEATPEEIQALRGTNEVGALSPEAGAAMAAEIGAARRAGDSVGGVIETRVSGLPVGLGEPFFDSVEATVAHLAFSVPGVKGIEFGAGFRTARLRGSENNDPFAWKGGRVVTRTNHAGGILGGLTTGMPVLFRVAMKPTPSIARPQATVDLEAGGAATLRVPGRHDPCIVPRAVVVMEAVALFALADLAYEGGWLR
ncbi:MAG: chorismate synthase [Thermoplasmata archaeon]|nr:chorismate synthase [Thermoplasmata archaeon]